MSHDALALTPSRPGLRVVLILVVLSALVAALVVVVHPRLPWGSGLRVVAGGSAAPRAGVPADRDGAIRALLASRGAAVRRHDAAAYRATQTGHAPVPAFDRLVALGYARWAYLVSRVARRSDPHVVDVDVRLVTRLRGEVADATTYETVTLVSTTAGWRVSQERTRGARAALWDLGPVTVVRGASSIVVGISTSRALARAYAAVADRAVSSVSSMWGRGWDRRAVVVVPRTTVQLGRLLGRSAASLAGFAAVTTAEGSPRRGARIAERVFVNTPAVATLTSLGREVVVRHELTHVATLAPERSTVPLWLVEGAAEYTGYRGSGIPLRVAVGDLLGTARSSGSLKALPTTADFNGAHVDIAYESAHLACALLVQKYGEAGLVRLYRLTEDATGTPDANVAAALRTVTGTSVASFQVAWRTRAAALAR
jgi:hypothetical protein